MQEAILSLKQYLQEHLQTWDNNHLSQISYGLPDTIFKGARPPIELQDPTYEVEKLEVG